MPRQWVHRRLGQVALILLPSTVLFSGCFPKEGILPGPLPAQSIVRAESRWPGMTAEALERGRAQFVTYCDNCHHYPDLCEYSEQRWPDIVRRMGKKAALSAEDSDRVLHFIWAARSDETGGSVAR